MQNPKNLRASNVKRAACLFRLAVLILVFGVSARAAFAQTSAGKTNSPNRYLFIVDTSFSMHDRAQKVQTIVGNLLMSGMNGEMHRGDSVGLWTFNDRVYTGRLPLQRWSPQ